MPLRDQPRTAIRRIAEDWLRCGIDSARIAQAEGQPTGAADHAREIFDEAGLSTTADSMQSNGADAFLSGCISRPREGVALLGAAGTLCLMRSPHDTQRLFQTCRIALLEGEIAAPLSETPTARVDLVSVDWQAVAEKLHDSIGSGVASGAGEQIAIRADARLRVSLEGPEIRPLRAAA